MGLIPIHSIKTKTVEEYIAWRRITYKPFRLNFHYSTVTNKTLFSDLMVLRQVLKHAEREAWIAKIPTFPKLTVIPRAGGWFGYEEIVLLIDYSKTWIAQAANPEERMKREYAVLYMKWLVFTGMRVDEALKVWIEDVKVRKTNPGKRVKQCTVVTIKGGGTELSQGCDRNDWTTCNGRGIS